MKKQIITIIVPVIISLVLLNSCNKSDNSATSGAAALQAIKNDPTLTIFSAIESRAGDDALFTNGYAYAVPVDTAFTSIGITSITVASLSQSACDSIVRYYIIPNGISFGGTTNSELAFGTSLQNTSLYADSTSTSLYFDGVIATSSIPVIADLSSIYKLTQVVSLPASSLAQITANDPNLALFNEALNRTSLANNFTGAAYTLFMPTDNAFMNAGYPDIASIDAADVNTLTQILLYNTIGNRLFTNDIAQVSTISTLQGEAINISPSGNSFQLVGNSDPGTPATVISTGIFAGNVLTYKINQLLLP